MRSKFGRDEANRLNHLLIFGYDSLENLQSIPAWVKESSRSNGFDLDVENTILENDPGNDRLRSLSGPLKRLVEQDYLIELRPAHFQTRSDTWRAAETAVRASGNLSNAKGKKGQEELEEKVRTEMETRLYGSHTPGEDGTKTKRPNSDTSDVPPPKKQKRASGMPKDLYTDSPLTARFDRIDVCN